MALYKQAAMRAAPAKAATAMIQMGIGVGSEDGATGGDEGGVGGDGGARGSCTWRMQLLILSVT